MGNSQDSYEAYDVKESTEVVLLRSGACGTCPQVLDLAFVLDSSASINHNDRNNWQSLLHFVSAFVSELPIGPRHVQVAVVSFGDVARVDAYLNEFSVKNELRHQIEQLPYMAGNTYTSRGLRYLYERVFVTRRGDRPAARDVAILVVDGPPNYEQLETLAEAAEVRQRGIVLVAIGVGAYIERQYLVSLTQNQHNVLMLHNYSVITSQVDVVLRTVTDSLPAGTGQQPLPVSTGESA